MSQIAVSSAWQSVISVRGLVAIVEAWQLALLGDPARTSTARTRGLESVPTLQRVTLKCAHEREQR